VENNGKLEQFSIIQSACLAEHPTLRLHKIIYEIFDENFTSVAKSEVFVQP